MLDEREAQEVEQLVRQLLRRSRKRGRLTREFEDDLVQNVMVAWTARRMAEAEGMVEPLRNRDAWLQVVTDNAVNKFARKSRPELELDPYGLELPAERGLDVELRVAIRRALVRLDEKCRELLGRRSRGEDRAAMAQRAGITSNAMGQRLHRCRQRLRDLLEECGVAV